MVFLSNTEGVEASEVVGQGGESKFIADVVESAGSELSEAALLLQHSEDRFNDGLAASTSEASIVGLELAAHPPVGLSTGLAALRE